MTIALFLTHSVHACIALLAACALALPAGAAPAAPAGPIPIKDFFRLPAASSPKLSPDGTRLALLIPNEDGRFSLAVAQVANPSHFVGIARFRDADVSGFGWINDGRLWFDAFDHQATADDQFSNGLYAVDVDGNDFTRLIGRREETTIKTAIERGVLPGNRNYFLRTAGDGSDDVIIQRYEYMVDDAPPDSKVIRFNSRTREGSSIIPAGSPDAVIRWVLDRNLEPRLAVSGDQASNTMVRWRDPATNTWKLLRQFDSVKPGDDAIYPEAVDAAGQVYVHAIDPASADGARTSALFSIDPATGKLGAKPLLSLPGYDFDGDMLFDRVSKRTLGISYRSDAKGTVWFDKAMRADQEEIDKQLAGTINMLSCYNCSSGKHLVVESYSDRQSPVYFLYERATRKLTLIAASRPWLDSGRLAEQDFVRIKARDGLEFPVLVTRPQGKGPWPTVVLVHGGPFLRGEEWGFAPDTQFLASRGYLVIQPEFRGSEGYGDRLFKAGWKQWGRAMQDDVTDATRWAIAQGMADPQRIAITGASYGGYATMMGLIREPELYRAGINWVGVTDIALMYEIGWSDFMGGKGLKYGMPAMVGDHVKDRAMLDSVSPLLLADRIKQPVLLAYGEKDYRVPLPHGTKMRDALKNSGNTQVEWVEYAGEGHGWVLLENQLDFWGRFEKFLAKNLK